MPLMTKDELFASYDQDAGLRAAGPVHLEEEGRWRVVRYAEAKQVLADTQTFSNNPNVMDLDDPMDEAIPLPHADPPRHPELRRVILTAFNRRRIATLEERVGDFVESLLEQVKPGDRQVDVAATILTPLPVIVVAELLGVELDRRADFKRWADAALIASGPLAGKPMDEMPPEVFESILGLYGYFDDVLGKRREVPGDDLVSALLQADLRGRRLTHKEALDFCALLLMAGSLSTAHTLTNMVLCVERHPAVLERIRRDPASIDGTVEEVMRYLIPARNATPRIAKVDTELGGQQITAGDKVVAVVSSAHRDSAVFADPETFDIDRTPNPHLGFGFGLHQCLGASLARIEAKVALGLLATRFAGEWRIEDEILDVPGAPGFYAPHHLNLSWTG
jgi:cytochrome P450